MQSIDYKLAIHIERPGTRQCTISMAWRRSSSTTLLLLSLFCAGLLDSAVAKTHIVGGDKGWTQRNITATYYDEWAAQQTFEVDDDLLFVYEATTHNVWVVPAGDVASCNVANAVEKYEDANATVQLWRSGDFAFVCQYLGHCESGMKMKLTVESGATAPGAAPTPGGAPSEAPEPGVVSPPAPPDSEAPEGSTPPEAPETPEPPSETTPPSPSAASSLHSLPGLLGGGLFVCLAAVLYT